MKSFRLLAGLFVFSFSLTMLYLAMRAVLDIGGFCAEGGPYEIAVHCPNGVSYIAPLSIFAMIFGAGLYFTEIKNSPSWGVLFWTALFTALGWNFLDFSINSGEGIVISWMVCAVMFGLMGFFPLYAIGPAGLKKIFLGETFPDSGGMLALHFACVGAAIWLGVFLFGLL